MTDKTFILGKDAALEDSIEKMQAQLKALGFDIEEASWLNPVPNVWSVHIRDKSCNTCFTNGKGSTKKAALAKDYPEDLSEYSSGKCPPSDKLSIKNRRVLKGHFAKIYAMHWCDSDSEAGKQLADELRVRVT